MHCPPYRNYSPHLPISPSPHLPISPHSLFPIPYSLLPTPYSLLPKTIKLN
ncbi:MAG: hypothetical protein F6K53_25330 [Moorea sp. SIO4A1]|nr:hypothetical protein [Moorena sp. SIO4A1]